MEDNTEKQKQAIKKKSIKNKKENDKWDQKTIKMKHKLKKPKKPIY